MRKLVQARLDVESLRRLKLLVRDLGWSPSRVVREGLRVLEASHVRKQKKRIVGLGEFSSGIADLGSNKKHQEGFGR